MSIHIVATYLSTVAKGCTNYDVNYCHSKTKSFPLGTDINLMRGYGIELSLGDNLKDWVLWSVDEEKKPVVVSAFYLSTKSKEDNRTDFSHSDGRTVEFGSDASVVEMNHAGMLMSDADDNRNWVLYSVNRDKVLLL